MADELFEVEAIRAKRPIKTDSGDEEIVYQMKWVGWPESTNTWEPLAHLADSMWSVHQFETRMKEQEKKKTKVIPGLRVPRSKSTARKRKASDREITTKNAPSKPPTKRVPKIDKADKAPKWTSETVYYNGLTDKLDEPFAFSSKQQLKDFLFKNVMIPEKGKCFTAEAGRISRLAYEAQANGYFDTDNITEIVNMSVDLQIRGPPSSWEKLEFVKQWKLDNGDDSEVPRLAKCGEALIPGYYHTCKW